MSGILHENLVSIGQNRELYTISQKQQNHHDICSYRLLYGHFKNFVSETFIIMNDSDCIYQWISFQGDPQLTSLSGEDSILWNGANSNNNQFHTKREANTEGLSPRDKLLESLENIYKLVQKADTRIKAQERLDEVADQWRMVVAVLDRLLFVVFFSGILAITLWFMSIE